jgi:hypothetical protein
MGDREAILEAALREARRFVDYFANDRREFVGPGTPTSCLAHIDWALNPNAALVQPAESGSRETPMPYMPVDPSVIFPQTGQILDSPQPPAVKQAERK